ELTGQRRAAPGCRLDGRDRALDFRVGARAFLQKVQAAGNDHQDVVEVVRYAAGQLAERIELLCFRQMLLHLFQLELGVATLGDVAGDLGKADEPAVLPDRVDDDAGPEEGAVLADAPAFLLVTALLPGDP